jgi:hypothetical protein
MRECFRKSGISKPWFAFEEEFVREPAFERAGADVLVAGVDGRDVGRELLLELTESSVGRLSESFSSRPVAMTVTRT